MNKFFKWLVLSSEDPKQVALTIKGIILLSLPTLMGFLGDIGINVAESDVVFYITVCVAILGLILTIIGLVRKLINTFGEKEIVAFKAKKKVAKK